MAGLLLVDGRLIKEYDYKLTVCRFYRHIVQE